jgi:hypothetical protein
MDTTIFFTSATSATDSMLRIFCKIARFDFESAKFTNQFAVNGSLQEIADAVVPLDGKLHRINVPEYLNRSMNLDDYRFVINYRDPRDRLCNMYHWALIHPVPGASKEDIRKRATEIEGEGIDAWVLKRADTKPYENFWWLLNNLDSSKFIVQSYARLCLDFDSFVQRASSFFSVDLTDELLGALESERVEKLDQNKNWIGNRWVGSDIAPGRFKRELKVETVEQLNEIFMPTLELMAEFDPEFVETYLS